MHSHRWAALALLLAGAGLSPAADPAPLPGPGEAALAEHLPASVSWAEDDCCPPADPRFWFNAEFLLWWIEDHPLPVPVLSTGSLGVAGSQVILGGQNVVAEERHGSRFTAGAWLNDERTLGVEASYFFLGRRADNQSAFSSGLAGAPVQGIPVLAAGIFPPVEGFVALAVPGVAANLTDVSVSSFLEGAEANVLGNVVTRDWGRVDLLGGVRYLNLDEKMGLLHSSPGTAPGVATFVILDEFDTRNQFYGGQLGLRASLQRGRLFADLSGKLALGTMNEEANINGAFIVGSTPFLGGVFAQPSNIGQHNRSEFAWMHELTVNVGVEVNENIRAFVGYNFLWVSDVLRPGNQIDRAINPAQAPGILIGPPFPAPRLVDSSFWAQGINFGLQIRY